MFGYSNFIQIEEISSTNLIFTSFITGINRIGTSGFILISGYYLSGKGTSHNTKKIISFLLELNFVSVSILLASICVIQHVSVTAVIKSVFPLITQHYWYPFNYVILLIIFPYLNKLIEALTKKEHLRLLLLLVLICCVFLKTDFFYTSSVFLGHSSHGLLWWVLLYFTAGYIRKYGVNHNIFFGPVLFTICALVGTGFIFLARQYPLLAKLELSDDNSIIGYCGATSLFLVFRNCHIEFREKTSTLLHYLVPATFTAYLFQEHNAIREALWRAVNIESYASGSVMLLLGRMCVTFLTLWGIGLVFYMLYILAKRVYLDKLCNTIVRALESHLNI